MKGIEVLLLRHGRTKGNLERRYVGSTDESVLSDELEYIRKHRAYYQGIMEPEQIYVSGLKRCGETVQALYGNSGKTKYTVIPELAECDFGDFEYHNYLELTEDSYYQRWIMENGRLPFPHGESREKFQNRTLTGFQKVIEHARTNQYEKVCCVVHGGSIMAILDELGEPEKSYYDYQVKNLEGYLFTLLIEETEEKDRRKPFICNHEIWKLKKLQKISLSEVDRP